MPSIIEIKDISEVENLIKAGSNKDKIEGYLLYKGYAKKDVIAYLKELGLVGKITFRSFLYAKLLEGYYSIEDFESDILKYSDNTLRHIGVYNNERILGNNISAKYDSKIALLVEKERPLKGTKDSKKEKAGDSSEVVTKEAKKVVTKRAKKV